jgi:hypothetical protein
VAQRRTECRTVDERAVALRLAEIPAYAPDSHHRDACRCIEMLTSCRVSHDLDSRHSVGHPLHRELACIHGSVQIVGELVSSSHLGSDLESPDPPSS